MTGRTWVVDANNVFGSRPDGWWNDREAAQRRFTQRVAEWCRGHDDAVIIVFDAPLGPDVAELGGGNLRVIEAPRRGRNAADDHVVELAAESKHAVTVVSSDRGMRARLEPGVDVWGVGRFRDLIGY